MVIVFSSVEIVFSRSVAASSISLIFKACTVIVLKYKNAFTASDATSRNERTMIGIIAAALLLGFRSVYKELHADRETGC